LGRIKIRIKTAGIATVQTAKTTAKETDTQTDSEAASQAITNSLPDQRKAGRTSDRLFHSHNIGIKEKARHSTAPARSFHFKGQTRTAARRIQYCIVEYFARANPWPRSTNNYLNGPR
jgi:hypothetical protein